MCFILMNLSSNHLLFVVCTKKESFTGVKWERENIFQNVLTRWHNYIIVTITQFQKHDWDELFLTVQDNYERKELYENMILWNTRKQPKHELQWRVRRPEKAMRRKHKKYVLNLKKRKSYWTLTFGSSLETDNSDTDADMHSLSSSDHCSNKDVDSLENKLRPILLAIEATWKQYEFILQPKLLLPQEPQQPFITQVSSGQLMERNMK